MARTDILARRSEIENWIAEHRPKAFMCRQLRCRPSTLDRWLDKMGLTYSGNQGGKGLRSDPKRKSALEYIASPSFVYSHRLKKKLLEDGLKQNACECCGLDQWMGELIPLELHHIDGNRFNNDLLNLQILCPNCHAQTPSNAGKSIGSYA